MLPMKMKNMMNVSGRPQSAWRNERRSHTIMTANTTTHMTQSGMRSPTASTQTMNVMA